MSKKWNHNYYVTHREERRQRNKKLAQIAREFISIYKKKKGCENCGYKEHPEILVFHHIIPIKRKYTNKMGSGVIACQHWSITRIKREIKKCKLLCPNCHALIHYSKGNGYK